MKHFLTPYICILYFCCYFSALHSQNLTLKISAKDTVNNTLLQSLKFQTNHTTTKSLFFQIDSLKLRFEKMGFLNNRLDTVLQKDSIFNARFTLGNSTKTMRVFYNKNEVSETLIQSLSQDITKDYFDVELDAVSRVMTSIVSSLEQKGNAFSEAYLTNISVKTNLLQSKLVVQSSAVRTIDKVIVKGELDFPKTFIKHYFNIRKGTIFNRQKLLSISKQIKALPFVDEAKAAEVLFTNDSTFLYLYLKKKKSNKFDGLIGFSSNETTNNIQFNGYLELGLNNIFKGGERINLNWRNNGSNRQFFDFNVETPYIFNSSITPEIGLNIYKQDSTFINTKTLINLNYTLNYKNKIGFSYISESSTNLLDNPIENIDDYTSNLFGLTHIYTTLTDDLLYPTKFSFRTNAYRGSRKAADNKINQTKLHFDIQYLFNLNLKNSIFIRSSNGMLISENFFTNELFRLGGANSIRGFNEESIFSSLYTIANIEFRYRTSSSSYLYSITDAGFIQNELEGINQNIYSLGLGYTFNTNFGLINLSYALGKTNNLPFNFNDSRFHLKIINLF